jgi:hypothetical protein
MKRSYTGSSSGVPPLPTPDWSGHPYAQAYQNMTQPHNNSPLRNSVQPQAFDPYAAGPSEKRSRASIGGGAAEGSSDGDDADDLDEDDEEEDEDEGAGKKDGAAAGKKKPKDGKAKAKLTRGSK